MKTRLLTLWIAFALAAFCAQDRAAATSYTVVVHLFGDEVARGAGVLVADGMVLVPIQLIDQGDEYFVVEPSTGALFPTEIQKFSATLALLSVPGLTGVAATLGAVAPEAGASVRLALPDSTFRDGVLASISPADSVNAGAYRFTITVRANEVGTPVVNHCGGLIALATGSAGPDSTGLGTTRDGLAAFMTEHGVSFNTEPEPCPSLETRLQEAVQAASDLEAEQQALEDRLASLEDSAEAARRQSETRLNELGQQRANLEGQLEDTRQQINQRDSVIQQIPGLQAELDSAQAQSEDMQRQMTEQEAQARLRQQGYAIGGAVLLLLLILLAVMLRRHRRRAQDELREAEGRLLEVEDELVQRSSTSPDIVLFGNSPAVGEIRARVSGVALAQQPNGIIIGRSAAQAGCVVNEPSVSRSHALIRLVDQQLMVEDLGSLNGTFVDGTRLAAGQQVRLSSGSVLSLGNAELKTSILES